MSDNLVTPMPVYVIYGQLEATLLEGFVGNL
jgi:hypothetical protein